MLRLRASELQANDVLELETGRTWIVRSNPEVTGLMAMFHATTKKADGQGYEPEAVISLPADLLLSVMHAWRTVEAPCLLCRDSYSHRMDIAVSSDPRGICGPCNRSTTINVLRESPRST